MMPPYLSFLFAPIYAHHVPNEHDNDKIARKPAPGAKRKYIHGIAGEQARGMTAENRVENNENVKNPDTQKGNI